MSATLSQPGTEPCTLTSSQTEKLDEGEGMGAQSKSAIMGRLSDSDSLPADAHGLTGALQATQTPASGHGLDDGGELVC